MWNKIIELVPSLKNNLKRVLGDFEKASIKAIKEVFGEHVKVSGCWFHFCQVRNK